MMRRTCAVVKSRTKYVAAGAFSTSAQVGLPRKRANMELLANGDRPGALFWPACATMMVLPRRVMTSIWRPRGHRPVILPAGPMQMRAAGVAEPGPVRDPDRGDCSYMHAGLSQRMPVL
jgi:hypothetical protein